MPRENTSMSNRWVSVPPEMMRVAFAFQSFTQRLRVQHHPLRVLLERRLQRLTESNRLCRNDMHEGTALLAREDCPVDRSRELLLAQDQPGARPAKSLVRGCGDQVRVRHRRRVRTPGHQTREVRHVNQKQCTDLIRNLPHAGEVENSRISAAPPMMSFGFSRSAISSSLS